MFGELAYFTGTMRQVDARAQVEATLIWIGHGLIEDLLIEQPDFAKVLLTSLANQLRIALNRIDAARHGRAEARLGFALHDMLVEQGARIVCTQQQLADYIGLSRVRTGMLLAELEQRGAIRRGYGTIDVIAPEMLMDADSH